MSDELTSTDARQPDARPEAVDRRASEEDPLAILQSNIAPHALALEAGVLDLIGKHRFVLEEREALRDESNRRLRVPGFPGLPLDLNPRGAANDEQARAVDIMARLTNGDFGTHVEYSLACIWARDVRIRGDGSRAPYALIARHLRSALENNDLLARWTRDPDFEGLVETLVELDVPRSPPLSR